jgi:hypothetical protein
MPKAKAASYSARLLRRAFTQISRYRSHKQSRRLSLRRVTLFRLHRLFLLPFSGLRLRNAAVRTKFLLFLWHNQVQFQVQHRYSEGEIRYAGQLLTKVIRAWTRTTKQRRLLRQLAPFGLIWRRERLKRKTLESWRRMRETRLRLNYEVIKKLRKRLGQTLAGWRQVVIIRKNAQKLAEKIAKRNRKRLMEIGFGLLRLNKELQIRHWAIFRFLRMWKVAVYRSSTEDLAKVGRFQRAHLLHRHLLTWYQSICKIRRDKIASRHCLLRVFKAWKQALTHQKTTHSHLLLKIETAKQHYLTRLSHTAFISLAANWSEQLASQRHTATLRSFQQHRVVPRLLARTFEQWKWLPLLNSAQRRYRLRTLEVVWRELKYCWKVGRMAIQLAHDTRKRSLLVTLIARWKGWAGPKAEKTQRAWRHRSTKLARNCLFALLEHSLQTVQDQQSCYFILLLKRTLKCWGVFLAKRRLYAQQASK